MKLEVPPQYLSKRTPRVRVWRTQMEFYMHLMCYAHTDWFDMVAMRVNGIVSSWVTVVLLEVVEGYRLVFRMWDQFKKVMV